LSSYGLAISKSVPEEGDIARSQPHGFLKIAQALFLRWHEKPGNVNSLQGIILSLTAQRKNK
jgi:hypothetical protein